MKTNINNFIYIILFLLIIINIFIIIRRNSMYKKQHFKNIKNYKNKLCIELAILILYIINVYVSSKICKYNVQVWCILILAATITVKFILINLSKY
ncbi:hypothetical protein DP129_00985 [Clostridium tetani]|uniref:hypothetical protein n=2 Tax=Clostridium tetani TaxID=1513 RepID=UPI00100A5921|nr:hypothetical protein [Clostridium tetani]RXI41549.1 hypothetical protein DP129_00985 [Clostridium tetani]